MVLVEGGYPLVYGTRLNGKRVLRADMVYRQVTESGLEAISDAPGFCENGDVSLDKAIQPGRQQMITNIVVHR
jgi:hypothetical protein